MNGSLNMTPKRRRRAPIHVPHQNFVAETNVYLHVYIGLGDDGVVNAPGAVHATQLVRTTEWYSETRSRRASESEEEESWKRAWLAAAPRGPRSGRRHTPVSRRRRCSTCRGKDSPRGSGNEKRCAVSGNGRHPACDDPHGGGPARVTCAFLWVR